MDVLGAWIVNEQPIEYLQPGGGKSTGCRGMETGTEMEILRKDGLRVEWKGAAEERREGCGRV